MATYTKLTDGTWGVRVDGSVPDVGQSVNVVKRDGGVQMETVTAVLWHGIARDGKEASLVSITPRAGARRMPLGRGHGQAARVAGYSRYCTANAMCRCYDCAS